MTVMDLPGADVPSQRAVALKERKPAGPLAQRLKGDTLRYVEHTQRVRDYYANGVMRPLDSLVLDPALAKDERLGTLAERLMSMGDDDRDMDVAGHVEAMGRLLGYGGWEGLAKARYGKPEAKPRDVLRALQADLNPNRERPFRTEFDDYLEMDEGGREAAVKRAHDEARRGLLTRAGNTLTGRGSEARLAQEMIDPQRMSMPLDFVPRREGQAPQEAILERIETTDPDWWTALPYDELVDEYREQAQAKHVEKLLEKDRARTIDAMVPLLRSDAGRAFVALYAREGVMDQALFEKVKDPADRAIAAHVTRTMMPTRMSGWWRDAGTNLAEGTAETARGAADVARLGGRGFLLAGTLLLAGEDAARSLQDGFTDQDIAAAQWQDLTRAKLQERGWFGEGALMGVRSLPYTALLAAGPLAGVAGARVGLTGAARAAGALSKAGQGAAMASISAQIHDGAVTQLAAEGKEINEAEVWSASLAGGFVSMLLERVQVGMVGNAYRPAVTAGVRAVGGEAIAAALAATKVVALMVKETATEIPQETIEGVAQNIATATDAPFETALRETIEMIPELFASMGILSAFGIPGNIASSRREAGLAVGRMNLKDIQSRVELLKAEKLALDEELKGFKPDTATDEQWAALLAAVQSAPDEAARLEAIKAAGFATGDDFVEAAMREADIRRRMEQEETAARTQEKDIVAKQTRTRVELLGYEQRAGRFFPSEQERAAQDDVVRRFERALPGGAPTVIVDSLADLPPEVKARADAEIARIGKQPDEVIQEGFLDEGTVYLIRDGIDSERRLRQVWVHEQIGHFGVREYMKARGLMLDEVREQLEAEGVTPDVIGEMLPEYRGADNETLLEEYISAISEKVADEVELTPQEQGVWARVLAFLRKLFLGEQAETRYEPADGGERVVAELVREVMKWRREGSPSLRPAPRQSMRGATLEPTEAEAGPDTPGEAADPEVFDPVQPEAAPEASPDGEQALPGVVKALGRYLPVLIPGSRPVPARYALIDVEDLVPTHDPGTFQKNPAHALGNTRDYTRQASLQQNVIDHARNLLPDELLDLGGGNDRGGPVVMADGTVLGGNSRAMTAQRAARVHPDQWAAYTQALRERAELLGLDPAAVTERSVLVRLADVASDAEAVQLVPKLNRQAQNAESAQEQAFALAGLMDPAALAELEVREGETLQAALKARGKPLLDELVKSGTIPREQYNRLVNRDGTLSGEGADVLELALFAKVVGSLDYYWDMTPGQRDAVLRSMGGVLRIRAAIEDGRLEPGADLAPHIRAALEAWGRRGDDYRQEEMFPEEMTRAAEGIAKVFQVYSERRAGIGPAMRRVADEIMAYSKGDAAELDFLGGDDAVADADWQDVIATALMNEVNAELGRRWTERQEKQAERVSKAEDALLRAKEARKTAVSKQAKAKAKAAVEKAEAGLATAREDMVAEGRATPAPVRFSLRAVTPEQDAAYLAAVERGDMATAQRLVDEAAKRAGYNSPKVYHGTGAEFTIFGKRGVVTKARSARLAFFFTTDEATARSYATNAAQDFPVQQVLAEAEAAERRGDWDGYEAAIIRAEQMETPEQQIARRANERVVTAYLRGEWAEFDAEGKTPQELVGNGDIDNGIWRRLAKAKTAGKTGMLFRNLDDASGLYNRPSDHYAVFSPSQIKSADPVTYDDAGNVIPPSARFNEASNDIRFSLRPEFRAELDAVAEGRATPAPVRFSLRGQEDLDPETVDNFAEREIDKEMLVAFWNATGRDPGDINMDAKGDDPEFVYHYAPFEALPSIAEGGLKAGADWNGWVYAMASAHPSNIEAWDNADRLVPLAIPRTLANEWEIDPEFDDPLWLRAKIESVPASELRIKTAWTWEPFISPDIRFSLRPDSPSVDELRNADALARGESADFLDAYYNTPGEREAREVQRRAGFAPESRALFPPRFSLRGLRVEDPQPSSRRPEGVPASDADYLDHARQLAHSLGFSTTYNEAVTTESRYLAIGRRTIVGGFHRLIEVRVSGHSKWGTPAGLHGKLGVQHVRTGRPKRVYADAYKALVTFLEDNAGEFLAGPNPAPTYFLLPGEVMDELASLEARMRQAGGSNDAKRAAREFVGRELANALTGMTASVSGESLGKMLSASASTRSVARSHHALAVANIDNLFPIALLEESRAPRREGDAGRIGRIHYLLAPMPTAEGVVPVRMMVKEYTDPSQGRRIYTLQALEIGVTPASSKGASVEDRWPHLPAGVAFFFDEMARVVKGDRTKFSLRPGSPSVDELRNADALARGESADFLDAYQTDEPQGGDLFGTGREPARRRKRQQAPEAQDLFGDLASEDGGQQALFSIRKREFSDPEFGAALILSERILRGGTPDQKDAAALLPPQSRDKADKAVVDANRMAEAMRQEMAQVEGREPRMTKAVLEAGLGAYYNATLEEVRRRAGDVGELRGRAIEGNRRDRLAGELQKDEGAGVRAALSPEQQAEARKRLEAAITQFDPPLAPMQGPENDPEAEAEAEEAAAPEPPPVPQEEADRLLDELAEAVRQNLIKAGAFTPRLADWRSHRAFRLAYQRSLVQVLGRMATDLTFGGARERIRRKIDNLAASDRVNVIEARARDIVQDINRNRTRQTRRGAIAQVRKLVRRHGKQPSSTEELEKRKIDPVVQRWLHKFVRPLFLDSPMWTWERVEQRIEELEAYQDKLGADPADESFQQLADLTDELVALQKLGPLLKEDTTEAEAGGAVAWLEGEIDAGRARVEKAREERQKRRDDDLAALLPAIEAAGGKVAQWWRESNPEWVVGAYSFRDLVRDLVRFAEPGSPVHRRALTVVNRLDEDIASASHRAEELREDARQALKQGVETIFGVPLHEATAELNRPRKDLARFSRGGRNALSQAQVLQMVGSLRQKDVAKRAEASEEIAWRLKMLPEMEIALGARNLALLDWMVGYYNRTRGPLSEVHERITGLKVESPDPNYIPIQVDRDANPSDVHMTLQVVLKSLSTRVSNANDLDESANILLLFARRADEQAHYRAFGELAIQMRGLFASKAFMRAVKTEFGKGYLKFFQDFWIDIATDNAVGKVLSRTGSGDPIINTAVAWMRYSKLAYSPKSAIKQAVGFLQWIPEVGMGAVAKGTMTSVFTPQGWQAMRLLASSRHFRSRYGQGADIATAIMLKEAKTHFIRGFLRAGTVFQQSGEMLAVLMVGQGVLRTKLRHPATATMSREAATQWALDQTFAHIENSQASRFAKDQNVWIRRGGSIASKALQFTGPSSLVVAKEIVSIREALAQGTPMAWLKAVGITINQHPLAGLAFVGLGVMAKWLLEGEEPDEDDVTYLLAGMIRGNLDGAGLAGMMLAGFGEVFAGVARYGGDGEIPAFGAIQDADRVVDGTGEVLRALVDGDMATAAAEVNEVLTRLFPAWRDATGVAGRIVEE